MNSNTFLSRFGLNPNDFLLLDIEPIKTDEGYIYMLEQNKDKIPCPYCSNNHVVIKDYYYKDINCSESVHIKDTFRIKVPRFKCKKCNKTFIKAISNANPHSTISNNPIKMICNEFHFCKTFDEIAKKYHISSAKVIDIFDNNIAKPNRLSMPKILCIDEFHFSSKNKDNNYCVILVDWETKEVIDILQNRKLAYLREYFGQIPEKERKNVQYFVSDLYDVYKTIRKEYFTKAQHIADFFHISIQLTRAVGSIRAKVMNQLEKDTIEYKFMKKYWKLFISRYKGEFYDTKTFKTKSGIEEPIYNLRMRSLKLNDNLLTGYDCLQDLFKIKTIIKAAYGYNNFERFRKRAIMLLRG